jgi:hypothetical protein
MTLDDVAFVVELLAVDGVGDAFGPLHPAAITQKSKMAHTASAAVRFFVKMTPRRSDTYFGCTKTLIYITFLSETGFYVDSQVIFQEERAFIAPFLGTSIDPTIW